MFNLIWSRGFEKVTGSRDSQDTEVLRHATELVWQRADRRGVGNTEESEVVSMLVKITPLHPKHIL